MKLGLLTTWLFPEHWFRASTILWINHHYVMFCWSCKILSTLYSIYQVYYLLFRFLGFTMVMFGSFLVFIAFLKSFKDLSSDDTSLVGCFQYRSCTMWKNKSSASACKIFCEIDFSHIFVFQASVTLDTVSGQVEYDNKQGLPTYEMAVRFSRILVPNS